MRRGALILLAALAALTCVRYPGRHIFQVAIAQEPSAGGHTHENPSVKDEQQELWRLRSEGAAHFESGVGLKKALAAFEAALQHKPGSAVELFNLGATQRKLGDLAQAQQTLLLAIQADKSLPNPYYTLGLIYRSKGDSLHARQNFEQARRLAPGEAATYYQLGRLYREEGRDREALQAFIDALQLDPSHTGALYQLHLYYQENGAAEEAKHTFEEFSRIKRALSSSRRESNDDECDLSRPILGMPQAAHEGPASALGFELVGAPLDRGIAAFDANDIDGDGLDDLVTLTRTGAVRLWMNRGQGKFEKVQTGSVPGPLTQGTVALQSLARGEGLRIVVGSREGVFVSDPDAKSAQRMFTRISSTDASHGLSFVDVDHDGDVDIIVGRFEEVLINEGNATFRPTALLDTDAARVVEAGRGPIALADFDGRNAMDIVASGADGQLHLVRDTLGARYQLVRAGTFANAGTQRWLFPADVDGDGRIDLMALSAQGGLTVYYNTAHEKFALASRRDRPLSAPAWVAVGADFDNDGRPDVLAVQPDKGVVLWRNLDGHRFATQSLPLPLHPDPSSAPLALDVDNDGRVDVLVLQSSGELVWLKNTTAHVGGLITLMLKGLRSAPDGLHAEVEVRRGTFYAKSIASGRPLEIGLGEGSYAEVVRITWSDGFVESKFKVDGGHVWAFAESERVSGSCPSVFAWNGRRFSFISDAFISGPMGVPMRPGQYFPPDHDEYLRIPGENLVPDHGRLRITLTEELREAVFLDQVRLLAVDHPAGTEVYPNEYLMPGELPEFKLHVLAGARPPETATDQTGADVLDLISTADQRYPANFRRLPYDGFAEPQGVEIGLPPGAAAASSLRLLLTGWFYYFESTSLVAAAQRADLRMIWPQIQVWEHGRWTPVMPIGLPSGVDKTVVIDLTHKLPAGARRLRIWTNLALYWDRIALDMMAPPRRSTRLQALPLRGAALGFHGFSAFLSSSNRFPQPERFDYERLRFAAPWNPLEGVYTRYGEVLPVLHRVDSQFVVFGSGDELRLEFAAAGSHPVPKGWKRDYLLYLNGYVKDGDRFTAAPGRLEPLPFAGMKHYPYTSAEARAAPWTTSAYRAYRQTYQSRAPLHFVGVDLAPETIAADPGAQLTGFEAR